VLHAYDLRLQKSQAAFTDPAEFNQKDIGQFIHSSRKSAEPKSAINKQTIISYATERSTKQETDRYIGSPIFNLLNIG